jgi:tetratricopeptide (TPR) repeat protein
MALLAFLKRHPRAIAIAAVGCLAAGGGLGWWLLVTPGNPLLRLLRSPVVEADPHLVVGPYPLEEDFAALRRSRIDTIVTLLDPDLPWERRLLEQERKLAREWAIRLVDIPMSSLGGAGFDRDHEADAAAAADAVARARGRVYLHDYLGRGRVEAVRERLATRRSEPADQDVSIEARMKEAATARSERRFEDARALYQSIVDEKPDHLAARTGLGFSLLDLGRLEASAEQFVYVLTHDTRRSDAMLGLGSVRMRQDDLDEAAAHFEAALRVLPRDTEAKRLLADVNARRAAARR